MEGGLEGIPYLSLASNLAKLELHFHFFSAFLIFRSLQLDYQLHHLILESLHSGKILRMLKLQRLTSQTKNNDLLVSQHRRKREA